MMNRWLKTQPRIESFLNKDASLSIELRSNQLNSIIIDLYEDIELPVGLIKLIIEYENKSQVIHHQYQQYVAPKLLHDHYPRKLLFTYRILNYTSSIIALSASFYHLYRWLNQAAKNNISDTLPSTATISTLQNTDNNTTNSIENLPKFLTLFPIPGSLTILNNIAPNLFSTQYSSLYPSVYVTIPLFAAWTGFEFMKNIIFFNTNRNIQKLSYFMPVSNKTKSITDSLFNDWNQFFYTDNYGLCPKRFILSYTNEMEYILGKNTRGNDHNDDGHHNRLIRVDENDDYYNVNFNDDNYITPGIDDSAILYGDGHETKYGDDDDSTYDDDQEIDRPTPGLIISNRNSRRNSIIVPNPKYSNRANKLPLPRYKHFLLQQNTLFAIIMLHSTLLPISRALLQYNHLFLPNAATKSSSPRKGFNNLQSMTSHKFDTLNIATTKLMKLSNIVLSHTYCLLHVVSTSIIPVIALRSIIFGNISTQLQNVLNPMHLNNNANAANAALAQHNDDSDTDDSDDTSDGGTGGGYQGRNRNRNAFEEYIDKWSLSNNLTSISLMMSMVPYVNNFYAMMSVFSFGMTLGEGEDIMRWTSYRLIQNNVGNHRATNRVKIDSPYFIFI